MVLRTFEGSIKLLEHINMEPSRLKYLVLSPGDVTIRGLYELEKNGVQGAVMSAIYEAFKKPGIMRNCEEEELKLTSPAIQCGGFLFSKWIKA
ncbi:MAG: pyrroline-5-carboxylate reductase dimerization domain-containing protein [Fervidobacterium sp.]